MTRRATWRSWPPPARRAGCWGSSSCRTTRGPAWTASGPARPSPAATSRATRPAGRCSSRRPGPVVEQVERADRLRPQPHWHRGDGAETGGAGRRDEQRPAGLVAREVAAGDGRAGPDAVQAGPLVVLQLEDPQQPALLAGGGHDRQVALLVIEQQASGGHPE